MRAHSATTGAIFAVLFSKISFADVFGSQREFFVSPVSCDIRFCEEVLRQ